MGVGALNLLPVIIVLALVLGGTVWVLTRSGSSEPSRWRGRGLKILWGLAILGCGFGLVALAEYLQNQEPPGPLQIQRDFTVECPGADIYLGSRLQGNGKVVLELTGDEDFCVEIDPDAATADVLELLAPGTKRITGDPVPQAGQGPPIREGGFVPVRDPDVLVQRPDGSVDAFYVVVFSVPEDEVLLGFPIRVRKGKACRPSLGGEGSGTGRGGRIVRHSLELEFYAHEDIFIEAHGVPRGRDPVVQKLVREGASWWLEGFPPGAPTLDQ